MRFFLFFLFFLSFIFNSCTTTKNLDKLEVVDYVDLNKYTGLWYEISRLPAWFQRDCYGGVTATYELRKDGKITVINRCYKDKINGRIKEAKGRAWVVDKNTNAKLKVSFFWPIRGDYWIIDLDKENYEYAVVGHPKRKYLWILSRSKNLDKKTLHEIKDRLINEKKYKLDNLITTKH
jgi:apolipoprotein D and lipocalin family protein